MPRGRLLHALSMVVSARAFLSHPYPLVRVGTRPIAIKASVLGGRKHLAAPSSSLDGGWAGWEARFSSQDGKPLPVDDHYLPESFKEWSVDVWGLETQAFDRVVEGEGGKSRLERVAARYMVEEGCGCENVGKEVMRKAYEGDGEGGGAFYYSRNEDCYLAAEQLTDKLLRLEHCFTVCRAAAEGEEAQEGLKKTSQDKKVFFECLLSLRTRIVTGGVLSEAFYQLHTIERPHMWVLVEYDASLGGLRRDVVVTLERRWSHDVIQDPLQANPFRDAIDTATLRKRIVDPCFAEPEQIEKASSSSPPPMPSPPLRLSNRWSFGRGGQALVSDDNILDSSSNFPSGTLSLPGGLTIACHGEEEEGMVVVEVGQWAKDGKSFRLWRSKLSTAATPPSPSGGGGGVTLYGSELSAWHLD